MPNLPQHPFNPYNAAGGSTWTTPGTTWGSYTGAMAASVTGLTITARQTNQAIEALIRAGDTMIESATSTAAAIEGLYAIWDQKIRCHRIYDDATRRMVFVVPAEDRRIEGDRPGQFVSLRDYLLDYVGHTVCATCYQPLIEAEEGECGPCEASRIMDLIRLQQEFKKTRMEQP